MNMRRAVFVGSSPGVVTDLLSDMAEIDSASVSPLILLLAMLLSSLFVLCRPMRPSFSMATKLERILERGRGEPVKDAPVCETNVASVRQSWSSKWDRQGLDFAGVERRETRK